MFMTTIIAYFVISTILGEIEAVCPIGWLHHGGSCYLFSPDEFSWNMAQDICKEYQSGYLAEIETHEENVYLQAIARQNGKSYWLGGKDDRTEGRWYWANSNKPFTFSNWASGEPNNSGNEDCLHLFETVSDNWNDIPCDTVQNYICEASFNSGGFK